MKTITVELPDTLAERAEEEGLLAPDAFAGVVKEALRLRAMREMREAMDKLHAAKFPKMTMDEIQEEVNAVRAQAKAY